MQRFFRTRVLYTSHRLKSTLSEAVGSQGITKSFEDIPGPKGVLGLPYIGIALQLHPFSDFKIQRIDLLAKKWESDYGKICKVRLSSDWEIFLYDPGDIQKVFRNEQKFPDATKLLLFSTYNKRNNRKPTMVERDGEDWWNMRSPAQKSVARPKPMAMFIPKISVIADDFVRNCRDTQKLSNLPYPLMELATESIGMLCFNTRLGCLNQTNSKDTQIFMEHIRTFFDYLGYSLFAPVKWFQWFRTPGYNKFERASDYIMNVADAHVERCLKEIQDGNMNSGDISMARDLITTPGMTPWKASSVLIDFFRGGIESTANNLMILLYHLAKHQDKQEKLFQELSQKIQTTGPMDEHSLYNMPYLRACQKESMRLVFPVLLGPTRKLDKDIEVQGYHIPAGVRIRFVTDIASKSETNFENPDSFIPERWMRQRGEKISSHPFAYFPFGFGPRMCIGKRFAENEIQINTAKIVRNFRLRLPSDQPDIKIVYGTFASADKPFEILLEPRE